MIAQRTGRTIHELLRGGPGCEPMSTAEYIQWVALISIVEPHEQEEAKPKSSF